MGAKISNNSSSSSSSSYDTKCTMNPHPHDCSNTYCHECRIVVVDVIPNKFTAKQLKLPPR